MINIRRMKTTITQGIEIIAGDIKDGKNGGGAR
jgi:hypothetical protein